MPKLKTRKVIVEAIVTLGVSMKVGREKTAGSVNVYRYTKTVDIPVKDTPRIGNDAMTWAQKHWKEWAPTGLLVTMYDAKGDSYQMPLEIRHICVTGVYNKKTKDALPMEEPKYKKKTQQKTKGKSKTMVKPAVTKAVTKSEPKKAESASEVMQSKLDDAMKEL